MKRVLFILLCICLPFVAGKSFAQRYLPGQKGIQLTLGGVDDFGSNVKHLHGNFQVGLALSRYNRNHSRWLFGADYVKKHYSYKDVAIPKAQFTGEVGYFVPFISDRGKNVFFSAGLSALAADYLDLLVGYNMNAVFFQIRGMADAFYESEYEPWSKYITGSAGVRPDYDVLGFLVEEAHKRGIQFHAWLNPYRIATRASEARLSVSHRRPHAFVGMHRESSTHC